MKTGGAVAFWNINIRNFCKVHQNDPKLNSKEWDMKSTLMQFLGPHIPNFQLFRSTISHFEDTCIAHFMILPLTPMLKFQSFGTYADYQEM